MTESVALQSKVNIISGFAWKSSQFKRHRCGLPIIRIQNVGTDDAAFVYWDDGYKDRFVVSNGDLLLTLSGSFRLAEWKGSDALLNQRIVMLKPSDDLDRRFFLQFMQTQLKRIEGMGKHALVNNVSIADIKNLQIPLPPLSEQKRIAGILDAADALRAKRREALAQLDTLLQSTFLDMFGDPVTNPMGWEVLNGDKVFASLTYGTSRKSSKIPSLGALPVLRIPNVIGGQIDWANLQYLAPTIDEMQKIILERNDLLFVRTNGNPDYIGRCARFDGSCDAVFASYLIRGRISQSAELESEFIKNLIELPDFRHKVRREAKTTAGNFNLNTTSIRKLQFIHPPLSLQRHFAAIVESVEKQKVRMRAHLAELDTLFASLQSRAFNGEL